MLGLTTLGIVHTALSLVAVATGLIALVRDREITPKTGLGQTYIVTTILTCLTGFGIFQRGCFGPPHILGIITLIVLIVARAGGRGRFGRLSPYIETVSYSLTFFFHMIPGFTETATRLPVGRPLATGDNDPKLQAAIGTCFVIFLLGAFLQVRKLRALRAATTGTPATKSKPAAPVAHR